MSIWKILWRIFFHSYQNDPNPSARQEARYSMRGAARTYAALKRIRR